MEELSYADQLESVQDVSQVFALVKNVVRDVLGRERSGLMLGLAEMGGAPGRFVGAFYPVGSNMIVMNKSPLRIIKGTRPEFYKYYMFSVLLHEYLHTIGILDEQTNRMATTFVSEKAFGHSHPVTEISRDLTKLFPEVMYATLGWRPNNNLRIEIVENFDRESVGYIG